MGRVIDGSADLLEQWKVGLDELRELLIRERPIYHAFEYRGDQLLYDLCSGTLIQLNSATYALFRGLEQGGPPQELALMLMDSGNLDIEALVEEVKELHALGLFRLEPLDSSAVRDETVQHLHDHRQRNIMMLVHTSCNLACDYCYEVATGFHSTGGKMSFERAVEILEDYFVRSASRKNITVTFFGGEPLLNFGLIEKCVEYCNRRAPQLNKEIGFSITTNGTLLTEEIIAFLVSHRFSVMLSIDGDPAIADIHRHDKAGKGATATSIHWGKKLVAAQRQAQVREAIIRATLTRANNSRLNVVRFLRSQGFNRIMAGEAGEREPDTPTKPWDFDPDSFAGALHEHEIAIEQYLAARTFRDVTQEARDLGRVLAGIQESLSNPHPRAIMNCGVGNNMLAYTAKGEIYPCHRFVGDQAYVLGRVQNGGIDRTRLDAFYRQVLGVRDNVCAKCWAHFICKGKCAWNLAHKDGTIKNPAPPSCDDLRTSFERNLWLYKQVYLDGRGPLPNREHDIADSESAVEATSRPDAFNGNSNVHTA